MKNVVLRVSFIIAVLIAILMYQDFLTRVILGWADRGKTEIREAVISAVAFINDMTGNVAYKRAMELSWNMGRTDLGLEILDSVSTGPASDATIAFSIGHVFNLQENSLIVIREPEYPFGDIAEVDFLQGSFRATNDMNEFSMLVVNADGVRTESVGVVDYDMRVDPETRRAKIAVNRGRVRLTDKVGNEAWVGEAETREIFTEDLSKPTVEPRPRPRPRPRPAPPPPPPERIVEVVEVERVVVETIPIIGVQEKVWEAIAKERPAIDRCLGRRKLPKGSMINFILHLREDGEMLGINLLKSDIGDRSILACIISVIRDIEFGDLDIEEPSVEEEVMLIFS